MVAADGTRPPAVAAHDTRGRVAVITGAGNGIGAATALRWLQGGGQVVAGDVQPAHLQRLQARAAEAGWAERLHTQAADVADEAQVQALVEAAPARFGRLDALFNNAGIGGAFGPIAQTPLAEWRHTLAVLLDGVFLGLKHGARLMQAQWRATGQGGAIVSTASIAGYTGGSAAHAYSAAKAAVINLTRSVAVELAPQRIRVNAVAPGPVMTELWHRGREQAAADRIRALQPWPDPGTADDIADVVLYLLGDGARLITGETLLADGGLFARGPALFGDGAANKLLRSTGLDTGSTGLPGRQDPLSGR